MTKNKRQELNLNTQEREVIERLREHPEIMERVQSILSIASNSSGPIKRADDVEALLVDEIRHLGKSTMASWAVGAEERLASELKEQDASARLRKKKR